MTNSIMLGHNRKVRQRCSPREDLWSRLDCLAHTANRPIIKGAVDDSLNQSIKAKLF